MSGWYGGRSRHERAIDKLDQALRWPRLPWPTTVLWRWRYELVGVAVTVVVARLAGIPASMSVVFVGSVVAVALPGSRRFVRARLWCVVTAHRVRVACAQARIFNRSGRLPAVLLTRPMPFGERVLLWCPAGTAAEDFDGQRQLIRTACWADDVAVRRRRGRSQLIELDVIRWDIPPEGPAEELPQLPALSGRGRPPGRRGRADVFGRRRPAWPGRRSDSRGPTPVRPNVAPRPNPRQTPEDTQWRGGASP